MNRTIALDQQSIISSVNLNSKIFWVFSSILILSLLGFHIFQINALIKGDYLLGSFEKEIVRLSQENKNLEIVFSQINEREFFENLNKNNEKKHD